VANHKKMIVEEIKRPDRVSAGGNRVEGVGQQGTVKKKKSQRECGEEKAIPPGDWL